MLVLSRFQGESICIDLRPLIGMIAASPETLAKILASPLEISIVDIRGDKVRLGIEANRSIVVHREEIFSKINGELTQIAAAEAASRGEA